MQNSIEPSENGSQKSKNNWSTESFSAEATARRRVLLKGVGRGAAVLAATVPIRTLAGQQCTASGMNSALASLGPGGVPVCAAGFTALYWGASNSLTPPGPVHNWPSSVVPGDTCKSIFGKFTLTTLAMPQPTLFQVVNASAFAASDERHWICAWLNAKSVPGFPYTDTKVLSFYNSPLSTEYNNALIFFKTYMETRNS